MMVRVFARLCSSKAVRWNVNGVTTRKAGVLTPNTAFARADASDAVDV